MPRPVLPSFSLLALGVLFVLPAGAAPAARRISRADLEDKIRGGWAGQIIGVAFGGPTEFKSNGKIIEGPIAWKPESVRDALKQDDLYVEMTFAEVLDTVGLDATTKQFGQMFKDSRYELWHANAAARRLLQAGLDAPASGDPRHNVHANDIDFQIEADFIGLMTPGLPREANRFAERVGRVMNYGDGLYGGMFFAGMYAAAFFEKDVRAVVEAGLGSIPEKSGYARIVRDVLAWSTEHPNDWRATWQKIQDKWDRDDLCINGAQSAFNIDARLNGAYVVLGLLYGNGDMERTLDVSTRAGQDSDCNPSSAAGILGTMLGYRAIADKWKSGLPAMAKEKFDYTKYSFEEIVTSTVERAIKVATRAGGKLEGDTLVVPMQTPKAPKLEAWAPAVPNELVNVEAPAWIWNGFHVGPETAGWHKGKPHAFGKEPGAEAVLVFQGTGIAVLGERSVEGGLADVWLDGKKQPPINSWQDGRTHDDSLFHAFGLRPGRHELRIRVREDSDPRSKGRELLVRRAVVYGPATTLAGR